MDLERLYNWLTLADIKGLGNKSIKNLWKAFGSARRILYSDADTLSQVVGKSKAEAILNREGVREREILSVLKLVEREGINFLTLEDEGYPSQLKEIEDPPPFLFYFGEIKKIKTAGIVGTRKPSGYTVNLTKSSAHKVIEAGMGVVSGGARGVDWLAHEGAIERGGYTVCILGYGLLKTPPYLLNRFIKSNNVLISEFHPEQKGDKYTFPKRNRLIAAMGEFIFIPEAGKGSGSLITANYALKYGKRVYVHIGIGTSDSWEGCYRLIKEGKAELLKDIEEILENTAFGGDNSLINFLKTPRTLEEILRWTGKEFPEVNTLLLNLEMEGRVKRTGSYYQAV